MNGSAINQVLLNLPQSGTGSTRNANGRDSAAPDFAQTFQDAHKTQSNPKARNNPAADRATGADRAAAQRSAETERNAEIERNAETKRRSASERNQAAKSRMESNQQAAAEKAQAAKNQDKRDLARSDEPQRAKPERPANHKTAKQSETRPPVDDATAADQQSAGANPAQAGVSATNVADEQTEAADTSEVPSPEQTGMVAAAPTNAAQDAATASLITLEQLLAAQTTPGSELGEAETGIAIDPLVFAAETADVEIAVDLDVATTSSDPLTLLNQLLNTNGDSDTSDLSGLLAQAVLGANPGVKGPLAAADQQQAAEPADSAGLAGTLVRGVATASVASLNPGLAATPVVQAGLEAVAGLADDLIGQAANLFKGDSQSAGTAATGETQVATDAEGVLNAGLDKAGQDKSAFDKLVKTMIQASPAEAGVRDQIAAPAGQAASSSVLDYLARPQEPQGTSALRNFVVQTSVPAQVGQPQWSQAVGEKVLWLAAQNISSAEINLNPLDLGPMQVKVSVQQDQASVTFTSHHPVVREVLDQNLNRLRDMFSEQGLNLVNVDVSDRSFQRQQGEGKEQQGQGTGKGPDAEEETLAAVSVIKPQRLVDHYA